MAKSKLNTIEHVWGPGLVSGLLYTQGDRD